MSDSNSDGQDIGYQLEKKIHEVLGKSLHIRHLDSGSCNGCDFEMSMLTSPTYDVGRFGVDFVASPRHADMLLVTGGVTRHLEEAVRKTYHAVAHPKMVLAIGDCACGGSLLGETYAHYDGIEKIVPVFMRVPGCPPHPHTMMKAIIQALNQFEKRKDIREPRTTTI